MIPNRKHDEKLLESFVRQPNSDLDHVDVNNVIASSHLQFRFQGDKGIGATHNRTDV
jgi:hypothetical protein